MYSQADELVWFLLVFLNFIFVTEITQSLKFPQLKFGIWFPSAQASFNLLLSFKVMNSARQWGA